MKDELGIMSFIPRESVLSLPGRLGKFSAILQILQFTQIVNQSPESAKFGDRGSGFVEKDRPGRWLSTLGL